VDGVVDVFQIDDQVVEDALVVLYLSGYLAALLDQPSGGVGALCDGDSVQIRRVSTDMTLGAFAT